MKKPSKKRETLQEGYRRKLKAMMGPCPTCGGLSSGYRELAAKVGLDQATLWRFLSGKDARGSTLDAIHAFLEPA